MDHAMAGAGEGGAADGAVLLDIRDLHVHFETDEGTVRAVDGVDLSVRRGRTLGVVGESGCGKSITARAVLDLVPRERTRRSGSIRFVRPSGEEIDLADQPARSRAMQQIRGGEISMIFQEPMTSLNPVYTVGDQIIESVLLHTRLRGAAAWQRAEELLALVGIPEPATRLRAYPHQLSGGMRQRVMIAIALASSPSLLIADEPTTALDVTVQAQILELLFTLQRERGMSIVFITHDLGVVAQLCHDAAVLYLGQVVEYGPVEDLFEHPAHPYTQGLLKSLPHIGQTERLQPIAGAVPDPRNMPTGCRFADRCPHRMAICDQPPPVVELGPGRSARCWLVAGE